MQFSANFLRLVTLRRVGALSKQMLVYREVPVRSVYDLANIAKLSEQAPPWPTSTNHSILSSHDGAINTKEYWRPSSAVIGRPIE